MVTEAEELAGRLGEVVSPENVTIINDGTSSFAPTPEQLDRSERLAAHLRDRTQPFPQDVLEHQEEYGSPTGSPFERFIEYLMQLLTGEEQPRTQLGEWFVDRFGGDRSIERDAPAERDVETDALVIASETPERAPIDASPDTGTPTAAPSNNPFRQILANNDRIADELQDLAAGRPVDRDRIREIEQVTIANFGVFRTMTDDRRAQNAIDDRIERINTDGVITADEFSIYREIITRSGINVADLGIEGVRNVRDIDEAHELGAALTAVNAKLEREVAEGRGGPG